MMIKFSSDLDSRFVPRLEQVAAALSTPDGPCLAINLARVMKSESDLRADAWNDNPKSLPPEKRWNASGLIQFMPPTLVGVGWTLGHAAFRALNAVDQLPFVQRYYAPFRGKLTTVGAIYTATFLPALVDQASDPDYVLTAKGGVRGWAFAPNSAFDANGDAKITVRELEEAVARNCTGARWLEVAERITGEAPDVVEVDEFDLRTVLGIQQALSRLGYDVGTVDGYPGPKTAAGVAAFQKADGSLAVDGIVGPRTKEAIEIALKTSA